MLRAWSLIREAPFYRRQAFEQGLRNAGYDFQVGQPKFPIEPGEVLVQWNRYGDKELIAERFEKSGGINLVAENGFLNHRAGTPKFDVHEGVQPGHYYSLAIGGHNGSGQWHIGDRSRWDALEIELKPWVNGAGHLLICPSRGFGSRKMAPPNGWGDAACAKWQAKYPGEVRLRNHPGNDRPARQLREDLVGCGAMAIWASSAGVHALVEGIPVYCDSTYWVCKEATVERLGCLPWDSPEAWDEARFRAMVALSWHQWTVAELSTGKPFAILRDLAITRA